jgi:hypothetical protein
MHRRLADRDGFADLLTIAGVDELIVSRPLTAAAFRLVRDGKPIDRAEYGGTGLRPDDAGQWTADPARPSRCPLSAMTSTR